jgi:hypothetical protein
MDFTNPYRQVPRGYRSPKKWIFSIFPARHFNPTIFGFESHILAHSTLAQML